MPDCKELTEIAHHYTAALTVGDLDTVLSILEVAERDAEIADLLLVLDETWDRYLGPGHPAPSLSAAAPDAIV